MSEAVIDQRILDDQAFLKEKILRIEMEFSEINDGLHQIRPDYLEKLDKIDEILENPERFKPLRHDLKGFHRAHIMKSFSLI